MRVRGERKSVALGEVERMRLDVVLAGERLGGHCHAALDGKRQTKAVVVVGVLSDQVDSPGRERPHARLRHGWKHFAPGVLFLVRRSSKRRPSSNQGGSDEV